MSHNLWDRIKQIKLIIITSINLFVSPTAGLQPLNGRQELRKIGFLFDLLADAVDEVNATFSKQVQSPKEINLIKLDN